MDLWLFVGVQLVFGGAVLGVVGLGVDEDDDDVVWFLWIGGLGLDYSWV